MTTKTNKKATRRRLLKQAGLGVGLGACGGLRGGTNSGNTAFSVVSSKMRQLAGVDVLVVGGGPAGIGAAIGAARTGAKTMLIESHGFFGGVAAWSLGMPIN